jgi:hypothetical protein
VGAGHGGRRETVGPSALDSVIGPSEAGGTVILAPEHVGAAMSDIDRSGMRSRRSILTAAVAGAAAAGAGMLTRASPVSADGEPVVVGGRHTTAASPTYIRNERNARPVVVAESTLPDGIALEGDSRAGTGVIGWSGQGYAVRGESREGTGISAWTENGTGVVAVGDEGVGVLAYVNDGVGLLSWSNGGAAIVALGFEGESLVCAGGRVTLIDISGIAAIPAGRASVTVRPNVPATKRTFVLLTPRANLGARGLWYTTDARKGTFTIHISTPRASRTPIAWLMVDTGALAPMAAHGPLSADRLQPLLARAQAEGKRARRPQSRRETD